MHPKSYLPLEVQELYPFFIKKTNATTPFHNIVSQKNFSILSILKILYVLKKHKRYSSKLYYKSGIRLKASYLRYLHLLLQFDFIIRKESNQGRRVYYYITEKGLTLLGLFEKK